MKVKMKVLDHQTLLRLNESSLRAGRKQNLRAEQLPKRRRRQYIVNFHFDHKWGDLQDVRMSVILKPGVLRSVCPAEFDNMPELKYSLN
ncbi:MAG TPA: hypothetical protein VGA82_03525 [Dehalococcoidales bacterium]